MNLAHFTLDGRPLCLCSAIAYQMRLKAAGQPSCSASVNTQLRAAPELAAQFPGRIALVFAECPVASWMKAGNTLASYEEGKS